MLHLIAIICLGFTPMLAHAQTPPKPESKTKALSTIQDQLAEEQQRQEALNQSAEDAERDLEKTKKEIVKFADVIRESEFKLSQLEEKIAALTQEEKELTESLEKDYGSIGELILALERIKRVPPETLIMRPGAPLETAQSALLLSGVLPVVKTRAEKLSSDLNRLAEIKEGLATDREQALDDRKKLDERYDDMQKLLKKREGLYAKTQQNLSENKARIAALSKEAKSLEDLIAKLEAERARQRQASRTAKPSQKPAAAASNTYVDVSVPSAGQPRLPVTGYIAVGFGQRDEIGAKSEGVRIEARPKAIIVAPMGGVVRYVGYFKNYGNIVIIEHKGGYHSLIGGFESIETAIQRQVKSGEPIGKLPSKSSYGASPSLYYELRYNGQSVDPSVKFSELKS